MKKKTTKIRYHLQYDMKLYLRQRFQVLHICSSWHDINSSFFTIFDYGSKIDEINRENVWINTSLHKKMNIKLIEINTSLEIHCFLFVLTRTQHWFHYESNIHNSIINNTILWGQDTKIIDKVGFYVFGNNCIITMKEYIDIITTLFRNINMYIFKPWWCYIEANGIRHL